MLHDDDDMHDLLTQESYADGLNKIAHSNCALHCTLLQIHQTRSAAQVTITLHLRVNIAS